jgi:hypothetical protein
MAKKQTTIFGLSTTEALIAGGAIAVGYFGIAKPILNKLGVTKSNTDRQIESAAFKSAWDESFWNTPGATLITYNTVNQLVNQIYNYPGWLSDDYLAVKTAIFSLKTQSQVSYLAYMFHKLKNKNLYEYLRNANGSVWFAEGLSDEHLNELNKYVLSLPKYKI